MGKIVGKFFTLVLLSLLYIYSGYAQYQVNHFTTENGLPSNGIKGLQWDESTGFLWIATEAGLVRYNGMDFTTFDINNNPEIGSSRIVLLAKNMKGKILEAGESGNLLEVKENRVVPYFTGESFARYNYNYYCAISASDTLFKQCLKNPWGGLFTVFNNMAIPVNDTAAAVWASGSLYTYTISSREPVKIKIAGSNVKAPFKIGDELFYLNDAHELFGLDIFRGKLQQQELIDGQGKMFSITVNNSSLLWQAAMQAPILIQHGKAWIFEKVNNTQLRARLIGEGVPENVLFKYVQYKKEGNYLFLGSASKGIYIIHKNQLTTRQPAVMSSNQKNSFYSQVELPNGNIITNEGSVIGDNPSPDNFNIGGDFVNSVFDLNDSLLILGRNDSFFIYNKRSGKKQLKFITHIIEKFALAKVQNRLYFASQKGVGIIGENNNIDFELLFDVKKSVHLEVADMAEVSPGRLALATCEGLLRFDTKTKAIDTLLKLPAVCIRSIHKEGDYFFIGTYGAGFYVMKEGVIKAMPMDMRGYLKYTHCFLKDAEGFCWISTNNGLFKAKSTDIIAAFEQDLPQIYYHYLGKADGMETTEMNGGCSPCALKLANGTFSFPTMDGMLWFNPATTNILLPSGKIYIDKILVEGIGKKIAANQTMQLGEDVKKLELVLAVNAWCKKENLYLAYKLNKDNWLPIEVGSGAPKISLANLKYGSYILQVRKMDGFGNNNYSYTTISFTVATPFYQGWWFRILAVLSLAGIGYLIFRLRLRQYAAREKKLSAMVEQKTMDLNLKNIQLEKNDKVKTRLIAVINHDIITPLKFMHYAGNALVEKKGAISQEQQFQTISDITQTAKDMEMLSSQILNWIIYQNPNERMQKEEFDLHQLVEMVFAVLQFPARLNNTTLINEVPANFVIYQYLEPLRVLVYNLILNGINFTKAGEVIVTGKLSEQWFVLEVKDNGLGMTKEQIDNLHSDEKIIASANVDNKKGTGLGYMIIKDLLKMMDGTLDIRSIKNSGTTVAVALPAE